MTQQLLVGDVGGTKIRLALAEESHGRAILGEVRFYLDKELHRFEDGVAMFLKETGVTPDAALFAMAGPVDDEGGVKLTNRPNWPRVNPRDIENKFGIKTVKIKNDFAAMARAIPEMSSEDFEAVIAGNGEPATHILATGPGTGFGVSTLIKDVKGGWRVITGEGGHVAFSPRNELEDKVRDIITREHGYASTEMIVSGRGLMPVYKALCEIRGQHVEPLTAAEMLERADMEDELCVAVCELRAKALMGAIGDAALICGARDRIVLTGGVAERIVKWLQCPNAISRFKERGPMSYYFEETTVEVLHNPNAPLIGAAALLIDQGL